MGFKRSISHWTGGAGRANSLDKEHYWQITEYDANVVMGIHELEDNLVTSDGDYMAHTRNLNTESAPFAMAGMLDAKEYPLDYGPSPITRVQFEQHCKNLAEFHQGYGVPVTRTTCLTHAEVEPTLGVKQSGKWDLVVLQFEPTIRGAIPVGDYMRSRVRAYMGITEEVTEQYPTIRKGIKGHFVKEAQTLLQEIGYFPGMLDGDFGDRTKEAVINFQAANGLIADGIVGPSTWAELMKAPVRENRSITVADLRESGSTTIASADKGQQLVATGGTMAAGLTALDALTGAGDSLAQAEGALDTAQAMLLQYWPMGLVAVGGFVAYRYFEQIKNSRLSDAITGRNMGR